MRPGRDAADFPLSVFLACPLNRRSLQGHRMTGSPHSPPDPRPSAPTVVSSRLAIALACGALVLAIFAAYANSFSAPFVYDDKDSIVDNLTLRHLWPLSSVLAPLGGG